MRRGGECFGVERVAWVVHYLALLLPLAMSMVSVVDSGIKRPPIYWNSSNTIFHRDNNDHVIEVNLGDSVDFICPHYSNYSVPWEYYIVYRVNKMEYDTCVINNTSDTTKIIHCAKPNTTRRYTMLISSFQAIQGNPDFQSGQSYYFISTSGGHEKEINNQYQGACYMHNMRIILRVVPVDNSKPVTTRRPTTATPPPWHTPRRTTTTSSTTTTPTTTTSTTTTRRDTTPRSGTTGKPGGGGSVIFPNDNIIHVDGGDKNEGTITDSAATTVRHSFILLVLPLALLLTSVHGLR